MGILISNLIRYLRIIRILLLKIRLIMPPRFIVFVSSEDMSFQILIEEVLKLLRADKFPNKTDEVLGGNRL